MTTPLYAPGKEAIAAMPLFPLLLCFYPVFETLFSGQGSSFRRVGLVYIHVPRTGGTSLSDTVFDFWIDHFTVRQHNLTMPADVMALPRFSIVRNPWEKLLSTWSFIALGRGHDERIFVMNRHRFDPADLQSLRVEISATNGDPMARVFEIRCYA